jgi:hypothetical protein
MAAAGTIATAAVAALPFTGVLSWIGGGVLRFRAVAGLPRHPLPTYATFVVEGTLNRDRGTGTVTKSLYAGSPDAMTKILFPGTERSIRVTRFEESGDLMHIGGVVEGIEQLGPRERRAVTLTIDRGNRLAHADFLGTNVVLHVQ